MGIPLLFAALAVLAGVIWMTLYERSWTRKLAMIPTIGPAGTLTSYIGAYYNMREFTETIQAGYEKHRDGMFKIATMDRWIVVLTGTKLVAECSKAREEDLSAHTATHSNLQTDYTLGTYDVPYNETYQVAVARHGLTKNIGAKFQELQDEIELTVAEMVQEHSKPGKEWSDITALHTMADLICRVTNRVFFNDDLCRNKAFNDLNVNFALDMFGSATLINMYPPFLRPIVGRFVNSYEKSMAGTAHFLQGMIEERLLQEENSGPDYDSRSNDLLTWMLDAAPEDRKTPRQIMNRMLFFQLGAIHTTSETLTHVLFHLATNPDYISILRQEIRDATSLKGWSKEATDEMHKMDSFIRESQRFNGLTTVSMQRVVTKPEGLTFSNGVTLPMGTHIVVAEKALHFDDKIYEDARTFKPFRYVRAPGDERPRETMVRVSPEFLGFGAGRHSCPGRFFAATELKAIIAHILDGYDIALDNNSHEKPPNVTFGMNVMPNPGAKLLFRRRS